MRMIDADAIDEEKKRMHGFICDYDLQELLDEQPTIEPRHGLLIPDATLPRKGCYHCMFREGNLCKFLPASVPVVECGKRHERHKDCPLVEV